MSQGYGPQGHDGQQWGQQDPSQQQPQWGQPEQPGQQPQWGQPDPNQQQPQWGQPDQGQPDQGQQWGQPQQPEQPQWGQPSPAPAADPWGQQSAQPAFGSPAEAGYPGASPAPGAGYPGAVGATPQFVPGDGVNWPRVRMLGMSLLIGVAVLLLIRLGTSLATFLLSDSLAAGNEEPGAMAVGGSLATLLLWIANLIVSLAVMVLAIVAAVMGRGKARVGGIVVAAAIPVLAIVGFIIGLIVRVILMTQMMDPVTGETSATFFRIDAAVTAVWVLVAVAIMAFGAWLVFDTSKKKLSA